MTFSDCQDVVLVFAGKRAMSISEPVVILKGRVAVLVARAGSLANDHQISAGIMPLNFP